jgi:hypothetical protein
MHRPTLAEIDEDDEEDDEPVLRDQKQAPHDAGEALHVRRDPIQTQHDSRAL